MALRPTLASGLPFTPPQTLCPPRDSLDMSGALSSNAKAHGLGDATGFVKLISDKKYGEILGAHLIGPDVTELLPELTLARYAELTPEEIARNVHAHPTLSEALKEAAHGLEGHMINM